ncbi:MAG: tetratricopeptide repeat protein [Bacteroidetes bacterium]|nr:MAG: tetratricopeptide repeat protein [Bacteroidota bacterium]
MNLVKQTYIKALGLAALLIITVSCNKNSTSWMNRKYQNMVSRYNVYYNGTEKLKEVQLNLALNHKDNYNEVLDVFPYGDEQQAKAQEATLDEVIKKGSKIILNRPVSKWVDDAYLLVGKAYFFKADYYAAIETFQYINTRYKNTPIAQEATVWILKSYIMLKRYNDAEALSGLIRNSAALPPALVGMFAAATAEVYNKQHKYEPALDEMRTALSKTKKRSVRARYTYITAQLHERLGRPDSAKYYLQKVLKLNPTYDMAFNAKISLARNYDPKDNGQVRSARRYLRSMLRDDKNISYFDQIYYQLAMIEKSEGNTDRAIDNFKLSLQNSQSNKNQQALSYLAMADIYFNKPDYTLSQLYYDSTVRVIEPGFYDYKNIIKKQSVLSELIKYKVIVAREDSLQKLAALSPSDLDKKVDRWIKEEEQQRKKAEEQKEKDKQNANPGGGGLPGFPGQPGLGGQQPQPQGSGSNWYFYSQQQLSIGYTDFIRKWGNRKMTDDWRYSQKEKDMFTTMPNPSDPIKKDPGGSNTDTSSQQVNGGENNDELNKRLADIPEAKRRFYKDIPFTDDEKARSNAKIADALYNIGIIYLEKLTDMPEAINAFETLVSRFAGSEYEPRAYYYLHKIYKTDNPAKAAEYKNLLITKYPDTDYALLVNDGTITTKGTAGVDWRKTDFYNTTYGLFTNGRYNEVKSRRTVADTMLAGTSMMPKYELLYAMSVGKTESKENYRKELEKIIEQYPATEIGQRAKDLLDAVSKHEIKDTASNSVAPVRDTREDLFKYEQDGQHYTIVILPGAKADMNSIRIKIANYNESTYPGKEFEVVAGLLNATHRILLIRTFESRDKAKDYAKDLEKFHAMFLGTIEKKETEYLTITPNNYAELLKMKELGPYLSFYKRYYSK